MRERAGAVGGELTVESKLGRGTTVRGRVPTPRGRRCACGDPRHVRRGLGRLHAHVATMLDRRDNLEVDF
jgi:hypothetical protein